MVQVAVLGVVLEDREVIGTVVLLVVVDVVDDGGTRQRSAEYTLDHHDMLKHESFGGARMPWKVDGDVTLCSDAVSTEAALIVPFNESPRLTLNAPVPRIGLPRNPRRDTAAALAEAGHAAAP